jgi:hypothetical protein
LRTQLKRLIAAMSQKSYGDRLNRRLTPDAQPNPAQRVGTGFSPR